ncbi:MAG TPA: M48 family metalloprotease [Acidimicrobiales bacterium]|nr:M48 family metalloprotease [Acidimicrobiales bacterium]
MRETAPAPAQEAEAPAVPILPGARGDTGEFHHNRRRALVIAAVPALVVFALVTVACIAADVGVVGAAAGVGAGLLVWLSFWRGAARIVLRALGARPGDEAELARAENIVDGLCATMGVEPPDIVVIDEQARQAMALGRKSGAAVLVVTSGLLQSLDPVALEGVLAHELVHVKRADVAPATMAAAVLLPWATFFPVSGLVHKLAGRGREFRTDRLAVAVTRFPPGLREALVLMADGPTPRVPSPLARRGVARTTRWLWTVAMPETPGGDVMRWNVVGELDAPGLRVAALDEW